MTSSGEGMRKTRAEGELHLDRPLQVIVRRPREDLEEHAQKFLVISNLPIVNFLYY
jgi:hypothetical protein